MIIVTGGAGLIGSNLVEALNARGEKDILVVDHLKNGRKMANLADLEISDYMDRDEFIQLIQADKDFGSVDAVFHMGACSATTEWDGQYVMRNNYTYSKTLLNWCQSRSAQFLYASSASVYGLAENGFREERACELPINMYAYSKLQFDNYVRRMYERLQSQVVGFRFFNVYGPREGHKGAMASTPFHFNNQIIDSGVAKLFGGMDGYADGEQNRDFVFVGDCVKVLLWFYDNNQVSGIFNLGTGKARTFNDVVAAVIDWHKVNGRKDAAAAYIPFPESLMGAYQSHTQADISALRTAGYEGKFLDINEGVRTYLNWLNKKTLN